MTKANCRDFRHYPVEVTLSNGAQRLAIQRPADRKDLKVMPRQGLAPAGRLNNPSTAVMRWRTGK